MTVASATELWRMSATAGRHHQSKRGLELRGHRGAPAADRGGQSSDQRRRHRHGEQAREGGQGGRSRGRERPRSAATPRRAVHRQGEHRRRRHADDRGLKALANVYPSRDAPIVERLKAAGAIPIGHTNLPSGGMRWHCDSELWGATINPWDRSRTPGASSAGEAAAIATGMSPLGLGNDGLGSLRHPAQCCGISALKPTLGRVPQASSVEPPDAWPDRRPVDGRERPAGPTRRRPSLRIRGHRRADLARSVDRAGTPPRAGSWQADPSRRRARSGRPWNSPTGPGRRLEGGPRPLRRQAMRIEER